MSAILDWTVEETAQRVLVERDSKRRGRDRPAASGWGAPPTLAAAVLGVAFALATLHPSFLLGTGPRWQDPRPDLASYLTALICYTHDAWRFPLFSVPEMGYPEGGSIVYSDAIPILALPAKLFATATGLHVNPFGAWILLCYVLQAVLAARVAVEAGSRSSTGTLAIAALALSMPVFAGRLEHIALSSQFLLLWALLLYLRARHGRWQTAQLVAFPAVSLLVNAYLFAMGLAILVAAYWCGLRDPERRLRAAATAGLSATAVAAVVILAGFIPAGVPVARLTTGGWGHYSWNLLTLVAPPIWYGWWHVDPSLRDATGGQYEGESYLGLGCLGLLAVCVVARPRESLDAIRRHLVLAAVLLACAWYAASNRVFAGPVLILEYAISPAIDHLLGFLRVGGRFIWPVVYALTLAPALILVGNVTRRRRAALVLLFAILQVWEGWSARVWLRAYSEAREPELVDRPTLERWIGEHERVWQFPSWFCGGLGRDAAGENLRRETQIQLIAARLGRPMNSIFMSRPLKDCAREAEEARVLSLEPGTLYVFAADVPAVNPNVAALDRSGACRSVGWGLVCSASWTAGTLGSVRSDRQQVRESTHRLR